MLHVSVCVCLCKEKVTLTFFLTNPKLLKICYQTDINFICHFIPELEILKNIWNND